jgi:hypothetical protein
MEARLGQDLERRFTHLVSALCRSFLVHFHRLLARFAARELHVPLRHDRLLVLAAHLSQHRDLLLTHVLQRLFARVQRRRPLAARLRQQLPLQVLLRRHP